MQIYRISIQNNENTFMSPSKHPEFIRGLPRGLKILQSCNGLLLCCTSHEITNTRSTPTYYVLNPTTNHFVALANSPYATNSTSLLGVALAFDPSKSIHYKVICVQCIAGSVVSFQVEIYSSETRNWTLRKSTFDRPFHIDFSHGVYFNGAINWISRTSRLLHYHLDHEEGHGLVSRPPDYNVFRKREYVYFGESRGHLHLIEIYRPCFTQFDVMEMGRDYSGWFVKYHVDLDTITAKFPKMVPQHNIDDPSEENWYYEFVVLFLVREENEEETAMFLYIPCKVISYNLLDRTCKTALKMIGISNATDDKESSEDLEAIESINLSADSKLGSRMRPQASLGKVRSKRIMIHDQVTRVTTRCNDCRDGELPSACGESNAGLVIPSDNGVFCLTFISSFALALNSDVELGMMLGFSFYLFSMVDSGILHSTSEFPWRRFRGLLSYGHSKENTSFFEAVWLNSMIVSYGFFDAAVDLSSVVDAVKGKVAETLDKNHMIVHVHLTCVVELSYCEFFLMLEVPFAELACQLFPGFPGFPSAAFYVKIHSVEKQPRLPLKSCLMVAFLLDIGAIESRCNLVPSEVALCRGLLG
ncbi:F-box protein [Pyrus ussuriensis x Pyrus communis]|uniref:F-box protein n=1 Tax=Pyrus ussuriensis x Pyrus communis TaxID=2448454 RepID=A0A5N5GGL3_9ROSA|nr:F-box protein [Pyrus ussuriensis x Pyrus communis]